MKAFFFTATLLSLLLMTLTACVTETTGRVSTEEDSEEAADLNVLLGIGYLRQGDWQSARVKLEKATEQDPDNVVAHRALGLVYENLDDVGGAERHYRRAVALKPKDPDALNGLAQFLCKDERGRDEAQKIFDRALSIPLSKTFSNKAMLYTNAGICMKGVDQERAEDYLRAALAVDPQFSDALLQLADVAYQRGNYLQSRAFLERHMAVTAPSPGALWLGVRVENAMNNFTAADQYGNQLRVSFPESVETRQLLEQLRDTG